MPLAHGAGLRVCEIMTIVIESKAVDETYPGPLIVVVFRIPNTNAIWYCVQRHSLGPPKMLLVNGHPWGIESAYRIKEIRAMRLRKIPAGQSNASDAVIALIQKEFGSHKLADHLFTSLPLGSLLSKQFNSYQGAAGPPRNAVEFTSIEVQENAILIEGTYDFKPMALAFGLDWNLKEIRIEGQHVEFDREEWARAYAVWKRALENEIARTAK